MKSLPLTDKWLAHFMTMCQHVAQMSKDPSTKVGAVIVGPDRTVVATGFNGFPRGCKDEAGMYNNRELKYRRIIHAEMNAILTANKPLFNCTLFTWPLPPCDRCIPHIIQVGISHIVCPEIKETDRWALPCLEAQQMALEADVKVTVWSLT